MIKCAVVFKQTSEFDDGEGILVADSSSESETSGAEEEQYEDGGDGLLLSTAVTGIAGTGRGARRRLSLR